MSNQPVTIRGAIDTWLDYPDNRALSKSVITSKKRTLAALERAVGGPDYLVSYLTYQHFADAMTDLAEGGDEVENAQRKARGWRPRSGRSSASLEIDRQALVMFADFMRDQGWVPGTFVPLKRYTVPRKSNDKPIEPMRHVAKEDFMRLLEAAGRRHARDRVAVAIGLFFGRRISEVMGAQWWQVNLEKSTMGYRNIKSGAWEENLPFMVNLKIELETWHKWLEDRCGPVQPDWYVLPARWKIYRLDQHKALHLAALEDFREWPIEPNMPATDDAITKDIRKALEGIGWTDVKGEGMHTLRRTHAREWDEAGDLGAAQVSLGHKLRATTEHYTGNLSAKRRHAEKVVGRDPFGVLPTPQLDEAPQNVVSLADFRARRTG